MIEPMIPGPDKGSRWSRILLIAGAAVALVAVVSWFAVGSGGARHGKGNGPAGSGTCRIPEHGTAGTETPPPALAQIATALGRPDTTATVRQPGSSVYVFCYDLVDGTQLDATLATLRQYSYQQVETHAAGSQVVFTNAAAIPYAINVSVSGDLDASRPAAGGHGPLSITWVNAKP